MANREKNQAAVELGRKGGLASSTKLSPDQLLARSRLANQARWKNHKPAPVAEPVEPAPPEPDPIPKPQPSQPPKKVTFFR